MQLLNVSFVILVIKIAICVLPGVFGIALIACSEDTKRELRNQMCNRLFGVSNAIAYPKFVRSVYTLSGILIVFSVGATWFFLLRRYF